MFEATPTIASKTPDDLLRTSELRYRRLFEAARDGIFLLDVDSLQITDANPYMSELLGYDHGEFLGKELWKLGFFQDKKASKAAFKKVQAEGYIRYEDLPLKTKTGESREVEFVSNVYDEGGKQVIQCNIRDITDRKQLEDARDQSEDRYRALFDYAPDGIIIASPESYYLDANPGMCEMLGYAHSELIGMHATDIVARSETKDLDVALAEVMTATGYADEWLFKRKDGSRFTGEVIARIMPNGNLLAMVRDITDRQNTVEKLRRSEAQLNEAQRITHIGSWIMNLVHNELVWSDEHYRIFGLRRDDVDLVYDDSLLEKSIHKDDRDLVRNTIEHSRLTLEPFDHYFRGTRPDGSIRLIHSRGFVDADEHGNAIRIYGTAQDVTESRRAEEALSESNDNFKQLADNITDAFWIRSPDMSEIHYISPAFEVIWGVPVATYYDRPESWLERIVPEDRAKVSGAYAKLMKDTPNIEVEYRITRPDGEVRWIRSRGFQVRDASGKLVRLAGIITDMTEKKRLEDQFLQSQKLESVGRLAGGIAHDFNNMLTAIIGYSDLALRQMPQYDPARKHIEEVKKPASGPLS